MKACGPILAAGLLAAPLTLLAQAPATQPVAASAPASRPAEPLDPAVEKILDQLEARGRQIRDIECKLIYEKEDPIFKGVERFTGVLLFKEDAPNPRFQIRFDRSVQNGRPSDKKEWHVFDGRWYVEAREKTKTIVKHEVLRPGQQRELFRLGQGPFPLPFGQTKADIVTNVTVKLIPPDPKDPAESDHLECSPLPGTELDRKYEKIHFWIDRKQAMPVQVRTVEKEEGNQITATFSDAKLNTGLAASRLDLPDLSEYALTEDRLPEESKPAQP